MMDFLDHPRRDLYPLRFLLLFSRQPKPISRELAGNSYFLSGPFLPCPFAIDEQGNVTVPLHRIALRGKIHVERLAYFALINYVSQTSYHAYVGINNFYSRHTCRDRNISLLLDNIHNTSFGNLTSCNYSPSNDALKFPSKDYPKGRDEDKGTWRACLPL